MEKNTHISVLIKKKRKKENYVKIIIKLAEMYIIIYNNIVN